MRGLSKVRAMLTIGVTTVALLAIMGAPASADRKQVELWSNGVKLGHGVVSLEHIHIATCDTHADGVGIRTYYQLQTGATGYVEDANGANPGCTNVPVATHANPVVLIQVCTNNRSICTPWVAA